MVMRPESLILEARLKAWMLQALSGDVRAYEQFLEQVARMMRAYLTQSMRKRSPDQIEDLVQEVLFSIHRKKHTFQTQMPIRPWVYAIARYRMIDYFRSEKTKPTFVTFEEDIEAASLSALNSESPVTDMDLETLLADLSPKQRELILLAKVDGVPLAELATRYKMSLSSVKVTLHRTLKSLRKKSEKET